MYLFSCFMVTLIQISRIVFSKWLEIAVIGWISRLQFPTSYRDRKTVIIRTEILRRICKRSLWYFISLYVIACFCLVNSISGSVDLGATFRTRRFALEIPCNPRTGFRVQVRHETLDDPRFNFKMVEINVGWIGLLQVLWQPNKTIINNVNMVHRGVALRSLNSIVLYHLMMVPK